MRKKFWHGKKIMAGILSMAMIFSAMNPISYVQASAETQLSREAREAQTTVTGEIQESATGADLTSEGRLDWVQFNTNNAENYNRKNIAQPLITDVTRGTVNQEDETYTPTDTEYSFTDGTSSQSGSSRTALVMVNAGSDLEFKLPGSEQMRYVKIYTGAWSSRLKLTVLVNGQEEYSASYNQPDPSAPGKSMTFALQYQTASDSDEVKVRIEIVETYSSSSYSGNVSVQAVTLSDRLQKEEELTTEDWNLRIKNGTITSMNARIGGEMTNIPMNENSDKLQWVWNGQAISLSAAAESQAANESALYEGTCQENGEDLTFSLQYQIDENSNLVISAKMTNNGSEELKPESASLNLGFNTYLARYPDYEEQLFPTLLRCEKTHLWGYFSSPSGKIMTVATDQPVASYTLDYESGQHRIRGAALDLLHQGPLPERHPQDCDGIEGGETKEWKIYLKPVENLNEYGEVKELMAETAQFPIIDADHYTVAEGETSNLKILSSSDVVVQCEAPDGSVSSLATEEVMEGVHLCSLSPEDNGVYKILVTNEQGYTSEAMISCRMSWSWYMKQARQAAIDAPQKGSTHIESYMGLYSGYLARKYFPNTEADLAIDEKLEEIYPLMYDEETGLPTVEANRIQNHSGMMGILVDKYQASGDMEALEQAEILAGHILSKQGADGGYYNGGTDYTSVIYPGKSLMELMYVEEELANDASLSEEERRMWQERYDAHFASVTRAMDNLVERDGRLNTEGQDTFEDGANSCSYTQLSEFALMFPEGSEEREKYTNSALSYLSRHISHQQLLIPDSRMNGGTLRFWEAQYDVEMGLTEEAPNMMNSPHGWTAWSIYGYFNLYELTGNEEYLRRGMNALGSCAQLMSFDGELRWAFVSDPYRYTNLFVYDEENSGDGKIEGKHVPTVIGEQYVDMISTWWRAPANTLVNGYTAMNWFERQGSACDNDVHEIFKCIGEVALTKAYLVEKADGSLEAYNCKAERTADGITIIPDEDVVSNVSVKLNEDQDVTVQFYNGEKTENVKASQNPIWITTEENCVDIEQSDRDSSLAALEVSTGDLAPSFEPEVTEYTLSIRPDAESVAFTPKASSQKATVMYEGEMVAPGESILVPTAEGEVDKTVTIRVASENLASIQTYEIRILKGSVKKNIAPEASQILVPGATGANNDPMGLVDGKIDDHADKTTVTINTNCPQEITFRWDEPKTFSGVTLWAWYAKDQGPTSWDIQVTYDGTQWEEVAKSGTVEWQYSDSRTESHTDEFAQVENAVGLKLIIQSGNTTWGHFAVNEIEIFEKEAVADASKLREKAEEARKLEENDYTRESWEKFQEALLQAEAVLSKQGTDQQALDRALEELEAGMEQLEEKTEDPKSDLRAWILFVESLTREEYTKESWDALEKAAADAKAVAEDAQATQSEIHQATVNLVTAFGGLEYGIQKQHLQAAVEAAEAILSMASDYDPESLAALRTVTEQAKEMLADETASQDAVNQMTGHVIDAIVQVAPDADVSSLESLIQAVESLDADKYTENSWKALEDAVLKAEEILADPEKEKEDILNAYQGLAAAIRGLELKGNKEALASIIEKAEEILALETEYAQASLEGLGESLAAAKKVYEDENAGKTQVDEAVRNLTQELVEVRRKGDVDGDGTVSTKDSAALLKHQAEMEKLDSIQLDAADVNKDGLSDTKDAVLILQYAAEKTDRF